MYSFSILLYLINIYFQKTLDTYYFYPLSLCQQNDRNNLLTTLKNLALWVP